MGFASSTCTLPARSPSRAAWASAEGRRGSGSPQGPLQRALAAPLVATGRRALLSVDRPPAVVECSGRGIEGEVIATVVGRLVVPSVEHVPTEVTQQQRANAAMRDDCDVTATC
jgi:hypothetical protein